MSQAALPPASHHRSASLQKAFDRVGEPEAEFPSRAVLPLVSVLAGLLLIVGGGVALWWVGPLFLIGPLPALLALALVPPVLGMMASAYGWRTWGERWFLCPGGVVRQHGARAEACAWADFRSISQGQDQAAYRLHRKDGPPWQLDSSNTPEISELGRLLRLQAEKHGVAWNVVEVKRGGSI
jgi:hypothetical protein